MGVLAQVYHCGSTYPVGHAVHIDRTCWLTAGHREDVPATVGIDKATYVLISIQK